MVWIFRIPLWKGLEFLDITRFESQTTNPNHPLAMSGIPCVPCGFWDGDWWSWGWDKWVALEDHPRIRMNFGSKADRADAIGGFNAGLVQDDLLRAICILYNLYMYDHPSYSRGFSVLDVFHHHAGNFRHIIAEMLLQYPWDGGPLNNQPHDTPYIVGIYWVYQGSTPTGHSIPTVPPFSPWN